MNKMHSIRINVKSFEKRLLEKAILTLQKMWSTAAQKSQTNGQLVFENAKLEYLPTTHQKYTVLRSPHIDKKSREQFQLTRFHSCFSARIYYAPSFFFHFLKFTSFFGVQIKMSVKNLSYYTIQTLEPSQRVQQSNS